MASTILQVVTSAPGNFTVAHNLGYNPTAVNIVMQGAGSIWFQPLRYDANNLYLVASDTGLSATIYVYADSNGCSTPIALSSMASFTSTAPGSFFVPHNLGTTPGTVVISVDSAGAVWFSNPAYDAANLYLIASDTGVTGYAQSFLDSYAQLIF